MPDGNTICISQGFRALWADFNRSDLAKVVSAVLYSFRYVHRAYSLLAFEIGYGASDAEDAVVAACGKAHAVEGIVHEMLSLRREKAVGVERLGTHAGVAENAGALKALALNKARGINAALYVIRAFSRRAVFKLLVLKRRSLDDDIDAVEQRP